MEQMGADVVVIGTGPGGMAAVAAAVAADAEVVVIEAMDHIDGNPVWSTADLTFVDSEMQRRAGIADDEELLRLFARESAETYRLPEARGVRFSRLIQRPRQRSIDRMTAVEDSWMLGRAFEPDFASPSVKTHHRSGSTL